MERSVSVKKKKVMLLGYNPELSGGVVNVTSTLLDRIPEVKLVPYVNSYHSKMKEALGYMSALITLLFNLRRLDCLHIIVGSKGDVFRSAFPIFLAKLTKTKVVSHYHKSFGIINDAKNSRIGNIYSRVLNYITASGTHVFLSEALKQEFISITDNNLEHLTTKVIPNALNKSWFAPQLKGYTDRPIDVLFVGRWSPEKGVNDFLKICQSLPNVSFHALSNAPAEIDAIDNITLHNWGNEQEVKELVSQSKLILLPSYAEAYPTVLIEGLAQGTPFVASSLVGIEGIASESKGGSVASPGDIANFTNQLTEFLNNEALWEQAATHGNSWVTHTHDVDNIVESWRQVYGV